MKYVVHTSKLQCSHGGQVSLAHVTSCGIKINNDLALTDVDGNATKHTGIKICLTI